MNNKLTADEIAEIYAEAMDFKAFHRIMLFLANVAIGFWFLCPVFFGTVLPGWAYYIVAVPVFISMLLCVPKHYRVLLKDNRLRELFYNPMLASRCALETIKTKNVKSTWIQILYYLGWFVPAICFFVLLLSILIPYMSQHAEMLKQLNKKV